MPCMLCRGQANRPLAPRPCFAGPKALRSSVLTNALLYSAKLAQEFPLAWVIHALERLFKFGVIEVVRRIAQCRAFTGLLPYGADANDEHGKQRGTADAPESLHPVEMIDPLPALVLLGQLPALEQEPERYDQVGDG